LKRYALFFFTADYTVDLRWKQRGEIFLPSAFKSKPKPKSTVNTGSGACPIVYDASRLWLAGLLIGCATGTHARADVTISLQFLVVFLYAKLCF